MGLFGCFVIHFLSTVHFFRFCVAIGNNISRVEGLEGMNSITELVLDRNKIKILPENAFATLSSLRELHLEENRQEKCKSVFIVAALTII